MMQNGWLLSSWLERVYPVATSYQHFQHLEFVEVADSRPQVKENLAVLLHAYHTYAGFNRDLLAQIGYQQLAQVIMGDQRPVNETTRSGNLMEILASELAKQLRNYEIPVLRLHYNPNFDQSMKGDDVLGFRFATGLSEQDTVLIAEAKFRRTFAAKAVEEGYNALKNGFRPYPASIEFVATVLSLQGHRQMSEKIRQIGRRLANQHQQSMVKRSYVLFLGTVGQPQDPFQYLNALGDNILPNLTAINIVFGANFIEWMNEVYDQKVNHVEPK